MFYIKQTKKLSDDITVQGLIVVHVSKTWRKKQASLLGKIFPHFLSTPHCSSNKIT